MIVILIYNFHSSYVDNITPKNTRVKAICTRIALKVFREINLKSKYTVPVFLSWCFEIKMYPINFNNFTMDHIVS